MSGSTAPDLAAPLDSAAPPWMQAFNNWLSSQAGPNANGTPSIFKRQQDAMDARVAYALDFSPDASIQKGMNIMSGGLKGFGQSMMTGPVPSRYFPWGQQTAAATPSGPFGAPNGDPALQQSYARALAAKWQG